jgi:hypothetical protein
MQMLRRCVGYVGVRIPARRSLSRCEIRTDYYGLTLCRANKIRAGKIEEAAPRIFMTVLAFAACFQAFLGARWITPSVGKLLLAQSLRLRTMFACCDETPLFSALNVSHCRFTASTVLRY